MNNANKIRSVILTALWLLISGIVAFALDPTQAPSNFLRTHFTTDQGLPGGVVDKIDQTQDGFLWLIANGGNLVRFDGTSFYKFESTPTEVAVAPDGDIWVGTREGLIRIPSSNSDQFTLTGSTSYQPGPGKASSITRIRFTRNGVLWVGTADGLFRYDGDQFVAVGPRVLIRELEAAPDGNLLAVTENEFIELAGSEIEPHPGLAERLGIKDKDIFHAMKDSHGSIWYSTTMGIAREVDGRIEKLGTYATGNHSSSRAYEDAQGAVWISKEEGLFRATSAGLELVAAGMKVRSLYGDRDGNLWVGTNGDGLYRFKDRTIRMFTTKDGLPNEAIQTVFVAHDGVVWTGANCGGLSRFDGTHFQTFNEKNGLANSCVYAIAEDADHDLWIGTWNGGVFRFHGGSFTRYSKNEGLVDDRVTSVVEARDGSAWFGTRTGVSRLRNGEIRNFTTADGLSGAAVFRLFEDRNGAIWAGTRKGLDRLVGERFENLDSVPKTLANPMGSDRDGGLFIALDEKAQTLRLYQDRTETVKELGATWDMVETETGELWFGGNAITNVHRGNFSQPHSHDEPLDYESFSTADGLATAETSTGGQNSLALTGDGKLWVATPKGLAMFDLSRLPAAKTKPAIYLKDVTVGREKQHASRELVFPPGTNHVQIDLGVVEISSPEKIRMQYRLDDVDSEWLDAGPDPHAIYSNIPVGTHTFHIRSSDRNGIWDRPGAIFSITQQPFFYQTGWFFAAMIGLGVLFVAGAYRWQVRQIAGRMRSRFEERLAERTRVARELHDSLLQGVVSASLRLNVAVDNLPEDSPERGQFDRIIELMQKVTDEGRNTLLGLRARDGEKSDRIEESLANLRLIPVGEKEVNFRVVVEGTSRDLSPIAREEALYIGREALYNAYRHSNADNIEAIVEYSPKYLRVVVRDDGKGIDAKFLKGGRVGHWGLTGMRERAEDIGAELKIRSRPGAGTEVELVVPGHIAFDKPTPKRSFRWPFKPSKHDSPSPPEKE